MRASKTFGKNQASNTPQSRRDDPTHETKKVVVNVFELSEYSVKVVVIHSITGLVLVQSSKS